MRPAGSDAAKATSFGKPAAPPSVRRSALFASAVLFLLAVIVLFPPTFGPPGVFDEGFVATGAMMFRYGWLPIRDYFSMYGPGQFVLTAGLFALFGEDLAVHRVFHILVMAALGCVLAGQAMRLGRQQLAWLVAVGAAYVLVAAFVLPSPGYASLPATLLLALSAAAFGRFVEGGRLAALAAASLLVGVAGLMRWDFGVFGICAHAAALLLTATARRNGLRPLVRWLGCLVAPWLALMLLAFVPLVLAGDARRWLDEVPLYALRDMKAWRGIDFVRPQLALMAWGLRGRDAARVASAAFALACAALPFVLAPLTLALAAVRLRRSPGRADAGDGLALALALLSLVLLNQMRIRPTLAQGFPAMATCLPLIAYLWCNRPRAGAAGDAGARRGLLPAVAASLAAAAAFVAQDGLRGFYRAGDQAPIGMARASGARIARTPQNLADWQAYAAMVRHVRSITAEGEPVFSGVADTSRLFVNDAMLYFLADRPSGTRYSEMDAGIPNTARGQEAVIADINRNGVRTVILWDITANEPNATARSNGVHRLDDFIRTNFTPTGAFGRYTVYRRKPD